MIEGLVVVFGVGSIVTTWLIVRQRQAREDLEARKRAAGLGASRLGSRLFEDDRGRSKKQGTA